GEERGKRGEGEEGEWAVFGICHKSKKKNGLHTGCPYAIRRRRLATITRLHLPMLLLVLFLS
ncbi:MAG: hypothetical protein OXK17_03595, partial [Thaumarchaeota archaeon]|nr:hypothetical protein [Nitrososphaerota archaeon]